LPIASGWVSWLVVLVTLLASDLASNLYLPGWVEPNQLADHKPKLTVCTSGNWQCSGHIQALVMNLSTVA
jgi:hypothetical protein